MLPPRLPAAQGPHPVTPSSPLLRYTDSRAMPDKPGRFVFVPLLVVGVIGLFLFAMLVPIRTCPQCDGTGFYQPVVEGASPDFPIEHIRCEGCSPNGKVPLLNIWRKE